jgi:hypothetical protein
VIRYLATRHEPPFDGGSEIEPPPRPENAFTGWELVSTMMHEEREFDSVICAIWKCDVQPPGWVPKAKEPQ